MDKNKQLVTYRVIDSAFVDLESVVDLDFAADLFSLIQLK